MSKCKVCGADAGFMGVICSACSTERAIELHHDNAQSGTSPNSGVTKSNSSELLAAAISAIWRDRDTDRGLGIARQIIENNPESPKAARAQSIIDEIAPPSAVESGDHGQTNEPPTEKQEPDREGNDWNENAGNRFARMGCGFFFVLGLGSIVAIWALAMAACGILAVFIADKGCPKDLFALFL